MVMAQPLSFNAELIKSEYPFSSQENIPFVIEDCVFLICCNCQENCEDSIANAASYEKCICRKNRRERCTSLCIYREELGIGQFEVTAEQIEAEINSLFNGEVGDSSFVPRYVTPPIRVPSTYDAMSVPAAANDASTSSPSGEAILVLLNGETVAINDSDNSICPIDLEGVEISNFKDDVPVDDALVLREFSSDHDEYFNGEMDEFTVLLSSSGFVSEGEPEDDSIQFFEVDYADDVVDDED